MVNFSLDLFVWNIERYQIVHFCIPKFKIKNVKSKWHWKESETDANAVSTRLHWEICSKNRLHNWLDIYRLRRRFNMQKLLNTYLPVIRHLSSVRLLAENSRVNREQRDGNELTYIQLLVERDVDFSSHLAYYCSEQSVKYSRITISRTLGVFFKFPIFWTKPKFPSPVKDGSFTPVLQTSRYFEEICSFCN